MPQQIQLFDPLTLPAMTVVEEDVAAPVALQAVPWSPVEFLADEVLPAPTTLGGESGQYTTLTVVSRLARPDAMLADDDFAALAATLDSEDCAQPVTAWPWAYPQQPQYDNGDPPNYVPPTTIGGEAGQYTILTAIVSGRLQDRGLDHTDEFPTQAAPFYLTDEEYFPTQQRVGSSTQVFAFQSVSTPAGTINVDEQYDHPRGKLRIPWRSTLYLGAGDIGVPIMPFDDELPWEPQVMAQPWRAVEYRSDEVGAGLANFYLDSQEDQRAVFQQTISQRWQSFVAQDDEARLTPPGAFYLLDEAYEPKRQRIDWNPRVFLDDVLWVSPAIAGDEGAEWRQQVASRIAWITGPPHDAEALPVFGLDDSTQPNQWSALAVWPASPPAQEFRDDQNLIVLLDEAYSFQPQQVGAWRTQSLGSPYVAQDDEVIFVSPVGTIRARATITIGQAANARVRIGKSSRA